MVLNRSEQAVGELLSFQLARPTLDYQRYNLNNNPFSGSVPNERVDFMVERGDEVKNISWTLSSALNSASTHSIIVGGYGNGKTHLLKYVETYLKKNANTKKPKILTVYVNTPGKSFNSLYTSIMLNLGRDFLKRMAWSYLGLICLEDIENTEYIDDEFDDLIKDSLKEDLYSIKKYVEDGNILLSKLLEKAKKQIASKVTLIDFTTAFLHMILEDYWFLAWKWLCGENIPYTQRKELELSMSIENDERALMAFLSLKRILKDLGFSLIVLLIDEFEVVEALAPREKQKILNELRHLIDLTPDGLCIVLSCAPEIWRTILSDYHAFTERFTHVTFLKPLHERHLREIIHVYLQRTRLTTHINGEPLYPFADDVIPFLLKTGGGNIRQTLKLCQLGIDLGLQENIQILNAEILETLLLKLPFLNISDINPQEGVP